MYRTIIKMVYSRREKFYLFVTILCVCLFLVWYFKPIAKERLQSSSELKSNDYDFKKQGVISRKTIAKDQLQNSSELNLDKYDFKKQGVVPRKTIPLVFVDEHHEVIPYWIREIQKGRLARKGNTLIHVDGHPDMDNPGNLIDVTKLKITKDMTLADMKPLMLRNDMFIVPTVFKEIYDSILWVYPKSKESRNTTTTTYVNKVKGVGFTKDGIACLCQTTKPTSRSVCLLHDLKLRNAKEPTYIQGDQCKIRLKIRLKFIGEENLETFLTSDWIKNSKNIVLDIDEDFFGSATHSARALSEISRSDFKRIDKDLSSIYCPTSAKEEVTIDTILRDIISDIIKAKTHPHNLKKDIKRTKLDFVRDRRLKSRMKCKKSKQDLEKSINILSKLWYSFTTRQLEMLRWLHFCLDRSPTFGQGQFGTCFNPGIIPQQFMANTDNILYKTEIVKKLFKVVFQTTPGPQLITVCRSLRDSYTLRPKFREIENSLLMALKETAFAEKISLNEEYDINLLFGKRGWVEV